MSELFPQDLIGLGTPEIEAFSSYVMRLAINHGVTVGRLLRYVGEHTDSPLHLSGTLGALTNLSSLVRPNGVTDAVVRTVSDATNQSVLPASTFLSLKNATDRSQLVYANSLRWCPACMHEFSHAGHEPYFKLVWQLNAVKKCPIHGIELIKICQKCGASQDGMGFRISTGECKGCGTPLSFGCDVLAKGDSWKVDAQNLIELVAYIAENPLVSFPADGVRRVVEALFDRAWHEEKERLFWQIIPRDECLSIIEGYIPITLNTARKTAYRLGMSLIDLLEGQIESCIGVLDPSWLEDLPNEMRPKKRKINKNRLDILAEIREFQINRNSDGSVGLAPLAKHLGVSTGYLRYQFPVEVGKIAKRRREWQLKESRRKRLDAQVAIMKYINSDSIENKTHKGALRFLMASTGLPKNVLREEISRIFQLLSSKAYNLSSGQN